MPLHWPLDQSHRISNTAIFAFDEAEAHGRLIDDTHLAKPVIHIIQHSRDISDRRPIEGGVTLDITCHTVHEMHHRDSCVGVIGVVIDDGGSVDETVGTHREEALVPVNVSVLLATSSIQQIKLGMQ